MIVAFNRRDCFREVRCCQPKNFSASVASGLASAVFMPIYGLAYAWRSSSCWHAGWRSASGHMTVGAADRLSAVCEQPHPASAARGGPRFSWPWPARSRVRGARFRQHGGAGCGKVGDSTCWPSIVGFHIQAALDVLRDANFRSSTAGHMRSLGPTERQEDDRVLMAPL